MSTVVVEVDQDTFSAVGMAEMSEAESREFCQKTFSEDLDGCLIIANKSVWRQFPRTWNNRWLAGNCVLIGDALPTAHFSIGSGTRMALKSAIALDRAPARHPTTISAALPDYETFRRPIVGRLVAAANRSAAWYENFAHHMSLDPMDFPMSYLAWSGRMDREKLYAM